MGVLEIEIMLRYIVVFTFFDAVVVVCVTVASVTVAVASAVVAVAVVMVAVVEVVDVDTVVGEGRSGSAIDMIWR